MLPTTQRVADAPSGSEGRPSVPAQGFPAQTPAPQPVSPTPVDAPAQSVDANADVEARIAKALEEREAKWKKDMDNLRSKLDSQYSRGLADKNREIGDLQARLESDLLSRMTEEERAAYEEESRRERFTDMQRELDQERAARQAAVSMLNYANRLAAMGVNLSGLDYSDPEVFFRDADHRFEDYIQDLRTKAELATQAPLASPSPPASTQAPAALPVRPVPPQVVTSTGTPPAQMTALEAFDLARKQLSDRAGREVTEEELWRMVETGEADLNKMIPGLSG